jgi:molecular chaperone GrpE
MAQPEPRGGRSDALDDAYPEADVGIDEVLDQLRRERANFLNYKRRVERERASDRELAQGDLLRYLIPFLDDLDRALGLIPPELEAHPWARGTALSRDRLQSAFDEFGIERIGAEGEPFDPARHEALFFDTHPDATEQRIGSVIRPGYRVGDRLVRPAQVSVVGPSPRASDDDTPPASEGQERETTSQRSGASAGADTRAGG